MQTVLDFVDEEQSLPGNEPFLKKNFHCLSEFRNGEWLVKSPSMIAIFQIEVNLLFEFLFRKKVYQGSLPHLASPSDNQRLPMGVRFPSFKLRKQFSSKHGTTLIRKYYKNGTIFVF